MDVLRGLTGREATSARTDEIPSPPALDYADVQAVALAGLKRDLVAAQRDLAQAQAQWDQLTDRADVSAHEARSRLAPVILERRATVARLTHDVAQTAEAVAATAALVARYTLLTADTVTRFEPLFDALARLTPEVIADVFARTGEVSRLASDIQRQTGDRQFRRPACDPFTDLRDALTESLKQCERQRLLRRAPDAGARTDSKTA